MPEGNTKKTMRFDVLIVSGARPQLLERTLESFRDKLFCSIQLGTCYINIDPFEGGREDVDRCEQLCKDHFNRVVANKPSSPHFTRAVRWLWSAAASEWCLHIEDDWILNRTIRRDEIFDAMKSRVTQISLMTEQKRWRHRSCYHYDEARRVILGIDFGRKLDRRRPVFGTSPSFIQSTFAKRCAELMRDELDPEKQLRKSNPELNRFTSGYRNRFLGSRDDFVATDIGREHRQNLGLEKIMVDGQSTWVRNSSPT